MTTLTAAYQPVRQSRSEFHVARGLRHHVRCWGPPSGRPLVLLHGARDSSAAFQFLVDSLAHDWRILAPDWRGHGQTDWTPGGYWISDFVADLDAVLEAGASDLPLVVVGHSMGGSIASVYAGVRPDRVERLVLLDALGPAPDRLPVSMPDTLSDLLSTRALARRRRVYADPSEMAARLQRGDPRLTDARAAFLAEANAQPLDGGFAWPHDPSFIRSWPTLHSLDEWGDCWRRITAPTLCLTASGARPGSATGDPAVIAERSAFFADITVASVPGTGHNVHHDAPEPAARLIERFLDQAS